MKVLIVEDEHKVVDYLLSGLTEQGWVVDVALDGEEGTHLATEYDYDVIVLDVMLPRRDGFSVLKALRMHTAYFQREVAKRIKLKFAAKIAFRADESFDEASRIDALLSDPRVKRDLEG